MQQTEKYKLNLVERDDVFSPDPLNENMEKVEGALEAARAEDAALDQRLAVLEARRIVTGTYRPESSQGNMIQLGFAPKMVIVICSSRIGYCIEGSSQYVSLREDGFYVGSDLSHTSITYGFLAIL